MTEWPDWAGRLVPQAGADANHAPLLELARYANPALLAGLGVVLPPLAAVLKDPLGSARQIAAQFLERGVSYSVETYRPPDGSYGQRIRTPSELLAGLGTCLDFTVASAAGCVFADIPVFMAILQHEGGEHAFLVTPGVGWDVDDEEVTRSIAGNELRQLDSLGQLRVLDATPLPAAEARQLTFAESLAALKLSRDDTLDALDKTGAVVHMVYVQRAVSAQHPFHDPPPRPRSFGITAHLPEQLPTVESYPSRRTEIERLAQASGVVVVLGPSGVGKSTLALERARLVAGGRGWWLDASDRAALQTSFAAAEAQSRGEPLRNRLEETLAEYSADARQRLRTSQAPWVVVLDNADGPPDKIADLLPVPSRDQLVIITTTNPEWGRNTQAPGWTLITIDRLAPQDYRADTPWTLAEEIRLPGLLRIANLNLRDVTRHVDSAEDLIGLVIGSREEFAAGLNTREPAAAVLAAAVFCPPEDVREDRLVNVLPGVAGIRAALSDLVDRGLLEPSRRLIDVRRPNERTFWMHRIVRNALRRAYLEPSSNVSDVACRVLDDEVSARPPIIRSNEDLFDLAGFLAAACKFDEVPDSMPSAVLAVLAQLEPRGGDCIPAAAALGNAALPYFARSGQPAVTRAIAALSIARLAVQTTVTPEELEAALELCQATIPTLSDEPLTLGRVEAVFGILLKKKGGALRKKDSATADALIEQGIQMLVTSYHDRAEALGWDYEEMSWTTPDSPDRDPEHHVDRAWFNLGGAYIEKAKGFLGKEDDEDARESLRYSWTLALEAYAGSLALRPRDDLYAAASAWGVALVLYMAALNDVTLDLTRVLLSGDLDRLLLSEDRRQYLLVAETCATRAHAIRSRITGPFSGDSAKTRTVMLKVSIGWFMARRPVAEIRGALDEVSRMILGDVGRDTAN
ncbi:MAG: hypothetical protein QOD07_2038 [Frankiaceae bacterium]|jgi:hypothetical protein|nr:hypothetical protein [Frankiaceae bacterium]